MLLHQQHDFFREYNLATDTSGWKNYLTKVEEGQKVSTQFSYGTTLSTISDAESDDSILLYITPDRLSEHPEDVIDKFGNKIICNMEDNPYILEFFNE